MGTLCAVWFSRDGLPVRLGCSCALHVALAVLSAQSAVSSFCGVCASIAAAICSSKMNTTVASCSCSQSTSDAVYSLFNYRRLPDPLYFPAVPQCRVERHIQSHHSRTRILNPNGCTATHRRLTHRLCTGSATASLSARPYGLNLQRLEQLCEERLRRILRNGSRRRHRLRCPRQRRRAPAVAALACGRHSFRSLTGPRATGQAWITTRAASRCRWRWHGRKH